MIELKDYTTVPSPEEIHEIVADCVSANDGYAWHFIDNVFVVEKGGHDLPSERDNTKVLRWIRMLPKQARGAQVAIGLGEILKMPASAVGTCNCFHSNDLLMEVAIRQFGICLLIVKDDDRINDKWPYQSPNYLDKLGSRVFLPLTFGLIHVPKCGNLCILQWKCARTESHPKGEACYDGYALEMKGSIRTKNVNLLTGVFDLSFMAFADFIGKPPFQKNKRGKDRLPNVRDY